MLPKIHKPNIPGRSTVNGIGSITEKISAYGRSTNKTSSSQNIKLSKRYHPSNTSTPREKLAPEDLLVTIDVLSLYTNIPHTEGIQTLNRILEEPHTDPMKKKLLICRFANLVLTKNYFTFNNSLYRQIQGTSMGTRMIPSYANIFIKYIEIQLIDTSPKKPKMWLRFIDDIIMIWGHGRNELENLIHLANNLHQTIKFSFTINNQEIPFPDTVIYRA